MRAPCCSFPLQMANESSPEGGCSQFVGMLRIRFCMFHLCNKTNT